MYNTSRTPLDKTPRKSIFTLPSNEILCYLAPYCAMPCNAITWNDITLRYMKHNNVLFLLISHYSPAVMKMMTKKTMPTIS